MTLREQAFEIAASAHRGQIDKAGKPYIEHPMYVADGFTDEITAAVALLHDVVEDSPVTLHDLSRQGMPPVVIDAVDALTKRPEESYLNYLARVKDNSIAQKVKLADLRHNMQLDRIPAPGPKDYSRMERYKQALQYLTD